MKLKKEKVMLVDSSDNLRHVIKDYLEMSGYEVLDYKSGRDANEQFNKGLFDICIIDVALKHYDGFKLLNNMRKIDKNVPIIVLSSYSSKDDRIKGFNLGCDDYVTKPFSIEELGLRMQAILRRCRANAPHEYVNEDETIKFGNFYLNYTEMQLIHPKITRTLTRKECELIKLLLDHKNKLVPREIILRNQQVILDSDVAELYGVKTKRVNEAVSNNPEKFPEGYIWEIDNQELALLRSKFSTTKFAKTRQFPKAFTEKGLYMLATILKSPQAVETTIAIVETYAKLKELSRVIVEVPQQEENSTSQQMLLHRGGQLVEDIITDILPKQSSETSFELNLAMFKFKHSVKRENDEEVRKLKDKIAELEKRLDG